MVGIGATVTGQESVDKFNKSLERTGSIGTQSAKQIRIAFQQLPAQFTDVATQLAGGQNPFLILLQQGGQVKDSFGGFANTFKALASALTPVRLAMGGVGIVAGVLGKVFYDAGTEVSNFNKQLALTGGFANQTYSSFINLSRKLADSTGTSVGASKDLVMGAIGSGAFGATSIEPAIQAMARVKDYSGATAEAVVKDFASMRNGVANWAAEHNRLYSYLTLDQYKYIKALELAGRTEEAMAENAKLLNQRLSERKPELGTLETLWKNLGNAASGAWDSMLNIGRPTSASDAIEKQLKEVTRLKEVVELGRAKGALPLEKQGADRAEIELKREEEKLRILQSQNNAKIRMADEQARVDAKNRKEVDDEASGLNGRKRNAALDMENIKFKQIADTRVSVLERQQQAMEALRSKGLLSESEYIRESTKIKLEQVDQEIAIARKEAEIEKRRSPGDAADSMVRDNRVAQLNAQIAQLEQKKLTMADKGSLDTSVSDDTKAKALKYYNQDLQFQIELLKLQGEAINMTDFEYQQLLAQKIRDHEVMTKTRGMIDSEAEAYRKAAEAAGTVTDEVNKKNYETSRSWEYGAKAALKKYTDEATNAAKITENFVTNSFDKMGDALGELVTTGKADFQSLTASILKDMATIAIKQAILKPAGDMFANLFGGGNSGGTAGNASMMNMFSSFFGFANGGVMSSGGAMNLQAYAKGGVASGPQLALFGEGRMNEAYVPLPDGRSIPVTMQGAGGGGNTSVVVNVDATGNDQVKGDTKAGQLGEAIANVVRQELVKQKRPGGLLAA